MSSDRGSVTSGPLDPNVDEDLREFDVMTGAADSVGAPANDTAGSPGEDEAASQPTADTEKLGKVLAADESLSSESSDPDVIHIDLTQRPPPLPMSGLALEQLVSMLPGSTYAVAGSGIPIRSSPRSEHARVSPRSEARQHSPTARPLSAETGADPSGSEQAACVKPEGEAKADPTDEQQAEAMYGGGGQASGSSPGSPHVALTFIPGLGLVPIVIHDALEEDEEDDEDKEDAASGPYAQAPGPAWTAVGSRALDDSVELPKPAEADDESENLSDVSDSMLLETNTMLADPYGSGGAERGRDGADQWQPSDTSTSPRLDISEEQLNNIIQQAMDGLDFRDTVRKSLQDGSNDDREGDEHEASQEGSEVGGDSPERQAQYERLFGGAARPVSADITGSTTAGGPVVRQLSVAFEGAPSVAGEAQPRSQPAATSVVPVTDGPGVGPTRAQEPSEDEEFEEYTDEGTESLDEVDDSGSGGGDGPESILGGLGPHARLGLTTDTFLLNNPASTSASVQQFTATMADVGGIHALDSGTNASTLWGDATAAAAARVPEQSHPTAPTYDPGSAAGLHMPRPRYLSRTMARSYDASHGPNYSGDSPLSGLVASRGDPVSGKVGLRGRSESSASDATTSAPSSDDGSSSLTVTPVTAGSSDDSSSSGSITDLNSTFRTTGQSLAAIRQAALQAEGQRMAKSMAERLGGGGDKASRPEPSGSWNSRHQSNDRPPVSSISNPFGRAEHEASAAAGLIEVEAGSGSGSNRHHGSGRRGAGGSSTGYAAHVDGRYHRHHADGDDAAEEEAEVDLEDLLRDRPIIQPRYPTDAKEQQQGRWDARPARPGGLLESGNGDLSTTMELDGMGTWRPRHRRSFDVLDLDALSGRDGADPANRSLRLEGVRSRSADGTSPQSPPSSRSLLATRKSDDGQALAPPLPSSSPRFQYHDSGSDTSGTSSSARSVADERLADELEALREELGQKTTLVAGLRGELRKYTDLAMRLEHQLSELRNRAGEAGSAAASARNRSQSDSNAPASTDLVGVASCISNSGPSRQLDGSLPTLQLRDAAGGIRSVGAAAPADRQVHEAPPPTPASTPEGALHTLPPHPQAQGLEGPARLSLYGDILDQAQLQVGRSGGPAPPDLRDAQELLKGKDTLDAGAEKVMLIKLRKIVVWGCEAAWKASVAQQQASFMEHAVQQAEQTREAWDAEREQLKEALEEARAAAGGLPLAAGRNGKSRSLDGDGAPPIEAELRRQLQAAQDEAAMARDQAEDLESAVASLNADVRRLRGQLRNSYDGAAAGATEQPFGAGGADAAAEHASRADLKAWAMERKMLLTTITSLKEELEQAREAASAGAALDGLHDRALASPRRSEEAAKKLTLADAALERVEQLQAERDAALEETIGLRRRLEEALADSSESESSGPGSPARAQAMRWELEQARQELTAARDALERRTADAEAAVSLHEQQSAALRAQVVEMRQELALSAAELAATAGWRDDERRALEAEREVVSRKDALVQELRQQLMVVEAEREEIKAALSAEVAERCILEEKLQQAREALATALLAAEKTTMAFERQSTSSVDPLDPSEGGAAILPQDHQEALGMKIKECEHLQLLIDSRTRELADAEAQLDDVRAAVTELQAEASETQAQVAELQGVLESMQSAREILEAQVADAKAAVKAAEERASDAHAASLLAEAALARAREESEVLRNRVSSFEGGLEGAREEASLWRGKAEEAAAALTAARGEVAELQAYAAGLQTEARDLRTALSAEDTVQAQLLGQVECLERELEVQASLTQKRSVQAARMKAALVEAEAEHHRHDVNAIEAADRAAAAAHEELRRVKDVATAAQQRGLELEARVVELQGQLVEALQRDELAIEVRGDEVHYRHADAAGERALTEPQVPDLMAQIQHAAAGQPVQPPPPPPPMAEQAQQEEEGQVTDPEQQRRQHHGGMEGAAGGPNHFTQAAASVAALEDRLRAAELECESLRLEVSDLRQQLDAAAATGAAAVPQGEQQNAGPAADQVAVLRAERAQLLADCAALHAELKQVRSDEAVRRSEQAQVEALRHQLQVARSELQGARADLQAASVELSVKGELMAAKDRSLATLQDTVDALKLALQVTQQNMQPVVLSPRRSAGDAEDVPEGEDDIDRNLQKYRGTVAVLQSKFADSESTIRRLEKQVAALETRLSSDEVSPPTVALGSLSQEGRSPQHLPTVQHHPPDAPTLALHLKEKEMENARLLQELHMLRRTSAAAATVQAPAESGAVGGLSSGGPGGASDGDGPADGAAIPSLHMQLLQWRDVSEDLHARYQSKKETVRRLREQLATEQQRRADEQAQNHAQLQAASLRLGRLATELGTALRRCIALDLQPLSATTLTTSPRALLGSGVVPDDINALASLLARQGAALVESLEAALDQVNTAREERALVTAQLANRQAVLDELRHHLARQAVSTPGKNETATGTSIAATMAGGAAAATSSVLLANSRTKQISPTSAGASAARRASELQATPSPASATAAGGPPAPSTSGAGSHTSPGSSKAASAASQPNSSSVDPSLSTHAAPASSPASRALHVAAFNLAQDMAALSAQQAGVRSALQSFDQRPAQPSARPRSLSATAYPLGASSTYQPLHTAVSYPAISPLRARNSGAGVDSHSALSTVVPNGSPPHAYVGLLSGSRIEPRSPLGAVSTGGSLHGGLRQGVYGMYGQSGPTPGVNAASTVDALRALETFGRESGAPASLLSPTRLQFYTGTAGGGGASAGGVLTSPGMLGMTTSSPASGAQTAGLGLSRERRLKLAETGL